MAQLGGAHRTTSQDMVSSSSPSCQLSMDKVFADGGAKLLTNDEICHLIAEKIAKFRSGSSNECSLSYKWFSGSLFPTDCNVPSSSSDDVPKSCRSFKDGVYKPKLNSAGIQQCTPKAAQPPEDHLEIIKAESKEKEFSHVQTEVAAAHGTHEEKTPLVGTSISEVTCEELTETCPGLTLNGSSSLEEHESHLNGNKTLSDEDDVSVEPGMQEQDPGINMAEMDNVQDVNSNNTEGKTSEDQQHCYISCKEKPLSCSLKDPQYEDVSSDPSTEPYEDGNQCIQDAVVETPSPPEVSEPTAGNSSRFGLDERLGSNKTNFSWAVFEDEHELDNPLNDSDDDDDDEWEVIPITIFNLKFEEVDDGECSGETSWSCEDSGLKKPPPKPVPASAFSQMEVFDTPAEQELAEKFGQVCFVVPPSGSSHKRKSQILRSRKESCTEPEDSCETDNSSDYSSGPESNFLTTSKQLTKNYSSSLQMSAVEAKSSNQDVIINLDSDEESGKDCVEETKGAEGCSLHKGGNTETLTHSWGTEKDPHVNDDDVIVILSDSDDDSMEICDQAVSPSSHSVDPKNLRDLKRSSSEPSKWDHDKPGPSRPSTSGKISFHESSRGVRDLTKKGASSSETEDSDDDLNKAGSSLCTNRKKVKLSEADDSLGPGPVIPRLFARLYPDSSKPVQLVNESGVQSRDKDLLTPNSSTNTGCSDLFRNKHSTKDKTGKRAPKSSLPNNSPPTPSPSVLLKTATPSVEQTNHARSKVFSDWRRKHVPIRRERKAAKRKKYSRHTL
ncbi:uncharacterized protein LOC108241833 [Kryptolebias marmoratus]|uniref:uncharacterized protein LOC108241833 n=1 Tax=Kryptolebias marmoratus TaxID=37003 RepID=UPI0007F9191D|nr:uncharacterized protein LOC108241833 [Kryptolebias marmoratus]